ncbi:hypothetical protein C0992_008949 [Termitomyces sp. T32_za158]|nr:hypothetical protein C0992_008949 [Termitomyces sp. T32_za158]
MGEKTEIRMEELQLAGQEESLSAPVASAGPCADKGKRKAAPASGPIRWARLEEAQAEAVQWRLETEELQREQARGYALAQEQEEELGQVRRERDEVVRMHDLLLHEQDEFQEQRETQDDKGLWEAHKLEGRQCEWLLRKVAEAHDNALTWAWEHRLLLDGLSLGVLYVMEDAVLVDLPLELAQGVV